MGYLFSHCSSLTDLDVNNFDTKNVTNMDHMFFLCSALSDLDVSSFDTSNVANMSSMFCYCNGLTNLVVNHFDTSNVTDMSYMFNSCSGLTNLDISNFETGKATDMTYMFEHCVSMNTIVAPENKSSQEMPLPKSDDYVWKYQPTSKTVTSITQAGTYVRAVKTSEDEDNDGGNVTSGTTTNPTTPPAEKPASVGATLNATNISGAKLPSSATFTVTSSDADNPTVAFNGVSNADAPAVTIPETITCNGVTYKVTSVSLTNFSNTKENGKYNVTSNKIGELTVEYKSPANKKKTSVTIPQYTTYKGIKFKVTSIAPKAFKNNKKVKQVTISASITTIGKEAFRNCKNLKKITIKSKTLKSVGKNALKGINKKCKIKVPKAKLKAYKKLFKKKGQAKSVKITK